MTTTHDQHAASLLHLSGQLEREAHRMAGSADTDVVRERQRLLDRADVLAQQAQAHATLALAEAQRRHTQTVLGDMPPAPTIHDLLASTTSADDDETVAVDIGRIATALARYDAVTAQSPETSTFRTSRDSGPLRLPNDADAAIIRIVLALAGRAGFDVRPAV